MTAAVLEIATRSGQGSQLTVLDDDGDRLATAFSPADPAADGTDADVVAALAGRYALTGRRGSNVAGRPATVVEASEAGTVARRWWIDDATGVLLWQETYDRSGGLTTSSGFSRLRIDHSDDIIAHLPPRTLTASVTAALASSSRSKLSASGWACPERLAELDLLEMRGDTTGARQMLHLVYGDGLRTVAVLQHRGRLSAAPDGSTWDADPSRLPARRGPRLGDLAVG